MFYKIYDNIKEQDPDVVNIVENQIVQHQIIVKIHQNLLKVLNKSELDQQVQKSKETIIAENQPKDHLLSTNLFKQ